MNGHGYIIGGCKGERTVVAVDLDVGSGRVEWLHLSDKDVRYAVVGQIGPNEDGEAFAWFNVGSNLTSLGRHEEAAAAYDQARVLGLPWRMLWYQFGPYESYYAIGRHDDVITLATTTLRTTSNLEESYFWRGLAFLAQGDVGRARTELQAALRYNPNFRPAKEALESVE